jgi:hypothetical protein
LEEKDLLAKMDDVANRETHLDLLISERETLKKSVIPSEVQMELDGIDFEFQEKIKPFEDDIKVRKDQLQALLKENAKPLKSEFYTYSYSPPKSEWDTNALDGYATGHPEILWMRHDGEKPTTKLTPRNK